MDRRTFLGGAISGSAAAAAAKASSMKGEVIAAQGPPARRHLPAKTETGVNDWMSY